MTNKYKLILMEVLACFLIFLTGGLLERERCWGSGSVKQYCFVSDHTTSNINITLDKHLHLLQRKNEFKTFDITVVFIFSSMT
jgi:hypothetical protein